MQTMQLFSFLQDLFIITAAVVAASAENPLMHLYLF